MSEYSKQQQGGEKSKSYFEECVDKTSHLEITEGHKVNASEEVKQNLMKKQDEFLIEESLRSDKASINKHWDNLKSLLSDDMFDQIFNSENRTVEWENLQKEATSHLDLIHINMDLYMKLLAAEHETWHNSKRLGDDVWQQSKLFLHTRFAKAEQVFFELEDCIKNSVYNLEFAENTEDWLESKNAVLVSLIGHFRDFESLWNEIETLTPEKLSEYRATTTQRISELYSEYSTKLTDMLYHDWDLLKDTSREKWEDTKHGFMERMRKAQETLGLMRAHASAKFDEKWDESKGMTEEQWNKMKQESQTYYESAQAKLDQINQAWHSTWSKLLSASKDEWEAVKHGAYSGLQHLLSGFNDVWYGLASSVSNAWYFYVFPGLDVTETELSAGEARDIAKEAKEDIMQKKPEPQQFLQSPEQASGLMNAGEARRIARLARSENTKQEQNAARLQQEQKIVSGSQ